MHSFLQEAKRSNSVSKGLELADKRHVLFASFLHIWNSVSRFDVPNDRSVNTINPQFVNRWRLILFLGPATRPPSREPSNFLIFLFSYIEFKKNLVISIDKSFEVLKDLSVDSIPTRKSGSCDSVSSTLGR